MIKKIILASSLLLSCATQVKAAVNFDKIPGVLFSGQLLTLRADRNSKLSSRNNPLTVTLKTADGEEYNLNTFVSRNQKKAQVRLPEINVNSSNIYRVVLMFTGESIPSNLPIGVNKVLLEAADADNFIENTDRPISGGVDLSNTITLPSETDSGIFPGSSNSDNEKLSNGDANLEISGDKNIKISANSDVTVILQSGTMATTTGLTPIAIKEEIQTIPSSDSIDVSGANYIEISDANSPTLSKLTNGKKGQILTIVFLANGITLVDNGIVTSNSALDFINLKNNTDSTFNSGDTLRLIFNGSVWLELSRSVN